MAVVVRAEEQFLAFLKGAPETIQERLTNVPVSYVNTYYKKYTRQGSRVLALAFKSLPDMTVSEARSLDRDMVESELTLLVLRCWSIPYLQFHFHLKFSCCTIRSDSATVLSELRGSSHDLAHVGVALLNAIPPQSDKSQDEAPYKSDTGKSGKVKKVKPTTESGKSLAINGDGSSKSRPAAKSESTSQSAGNCHLTEAEMQRKKLKKLMDELNEEGDGHGAPVVKLGDASMASPFTAKPASVAPTTDIICQGRSTLVTTLQMFKILGLNCLAYVLSVMYLDGVK